MAFVRIWVHVVFGTKNRESFLIGDVKEKTISHILLNCKEKDIFLDSIGGYKDHLHCLISLGKEQSIAKVVNLIKGESSFWINKNKFIKTKFEWADDYFAASISDSKIEVVRKYIVGQEEHHKKRSIAEEYEGFLKKLGV